MEKLSKEKQEKLRKIGKKFHMKIMGAIFLYFMWLFFCNFVITLINEGYMHNSQFAFLGYVGNTFIAMLGFQGTVREIRDIIGKEVKEVTDAKSDA